MFTEKEAGNILGIIAVAVDGNKREYGLEVADALMRGLGFDTQPYKIYAEQRFLTPTVDSKSDAVDVTV